MGKQTLWERLKRRCYSRDKSILHIILIFLMVQERNPDYEWCKISLGVASQISKCNEIIKKYRHSKPVYASLFALIIGECGGRLKSDYFQAYFKKNKVGIKHSDEEREWFAYFDIFEFCLSEMKNFGIIDDEKETELILDVERVRFTQK